MVSTNDNEMREIRIILKNIYTVAVFIKGISLGSQHNPEDKHQFCIVYDMFNS